MNNLYFEQSFQVAKNEIIAQVSVNKNHDIFKGHFPEQPVLPGVCMMQLIKELTEKAVAQKLILRSAPSCKFLNMLNPMANNEITAAIQFSHIDDDKINVTAVLQSSGMVLLKLNAGYLL